MAAVRSSPQGKHRARDRYPAVINDFELFVLRSFFVQKIAVLLLCAIPRQRALTRFIAVAVSLGIDEREIGKTIRPMRFFICALFG